MNTKTLSAFQRLVQVDIEEFAKLTQDSLILSCLRNHGVDSWEGWDEAITEADSLIDGGLT